MCTLYNEDAKQTSIITQYMTQKGIVLKRHFFFAENAALYNFA